MCVFALAGLGGAGSFVERSTQDQAVPEPDPKVDEPRVEDEPESETPTVGLREAVALALERNFGIRASAEGVETARINEGAARAQFYPKITPAIRGSADDRTFSVDGAQRLPWLGGSVSSSAAYRATTRQDALFASTSDLRLTLSQPLLRGFGPAMTMYDLRNSRRNRQGRERAHDLDRQRLAEDVTGVFYQVVKQRQLLAVAQQSQQRSLRLKEASEARLKVGLASKLDVLRAELQASQAEAAAVAAQSGLENALERFRFLLALPPAHPLEPEPIELPSAAEGDLEPLEVLVLRARENRLDLQETRDQVEDARRTLSVARQRLLPQIDLNVGVTWSGYGSTFSESRGALDRRTDVFLTTSYPLERASDLAAKASAEMSLGAHERLLEQKLLEVETDVRAAVRDLERMRKAVELQRKNVELAEQQHRLATLRYERGLASNFDVVQAEEDVFSARTSLVGLLADYQVGRVRLRRVSGGLDVSTEFWK